MGSIMDDGVDPREAANAYLKDHDDVLKAWLEGVTTKEGESALPAVQAAL